MKMVLLITVLCAASFAHAQNINGIKVIPVDSLKKYHIGIAKTDSGKIHVINTSQLPWSKMNALQKSEYLVKVIVNDYWEKYPITFWLIVTLLALWILKLIYKMFKK